MIMNNINDDINSVTYIVCQCACSSGKRKARVYDENTTLERWEDWLKTKMICNSEGYKLEGRSSWLN